ncbi:MAG TPA: helix-turn-helix transcriptional regulator [Candidatus Paceibacterota bacterium]|nr:helix-turn-helix transcriptional regulator [Verrucomicrobiota bacterium]HSA12193.1 helix-turn-helix transcriptional regulator [Candidatus Paceibacterota bacterium]
MNDDSPFAERLKALIQERGLTQLQVGRAAGVSKNAVGKWLRGAVPGARELFKLARAFEKPMEWFFEGEPPAPASEADKSALHTSPAEMPADKFLAATRALGLSSPRDLERIMELSTHYRQIWTPTPTGFEMRYEPIHQDAAPHKESSNRVLTDVAASGNVAAMQDQMRQLRARLFKVTAVRGQKAALAKWLGVSLSSISTWLAGKREPGGETALRLLHWVEQQEAQRKQSPGSVSPLPGPKTQVRKSYEKRTKPSPQKG